MEKVKTVALILVVFFSTSFYSDSARLANSESQNFDLNFEKLKEQAVIDQDSFKIYNHKINLLCNELEKF